MHKIIITVVALLGLAFASPAMSQVPVPPPSCVSGTATTPVQVSISFPAAYTAQANVSGGAPCGSQLAGYQYSWSNGGANSSQTSVSSNQYISVTVTSCSSDPDVGCGVSSASASNTAPNWDSSPPPSGGGGTGGTPGAKDTDGDGVVDSNDNCPTVSNADQADADLNGVGNACQTSFIPFNNTTLELSDSAYNDPAFDVCTTRTILNWGRCTLDASAQAGEKCQTVRDSVWRHVGAYSVIHRRVTETLCWLPSTGTFTRVKGTPFVEDLTCGPVCTYPYKTEVSGGPSTNFPSIGTAVVQTQFTAYLCPFYISFTCPPIVNGTLKTTYVVFVGSGGIIKAGTSWP